MPTKKPNSIDVHVGSQIRMQRLMLGMSQSALADHLGITFQQVQKYEKGTNRVGASRLQAIAQILDVSPGFFFQEGSPNGQSSSGTLPSDEGLRRHLMTRDGVALNRAFQRIADPKVRRGIIALVKALAEDTSIFGESGDIINQEPALVRHVD